MLQKRLTTVCSDLQSTQESLENERLHNAQSLKRLQQQCVHLSETMSSWLGSVATPLVDESANPIANIMRRLRQLERRLRFANNRLPLIGAQMRMLGSCVSCPAGARFDRCVQTDPAGLTAPHSQDSLTYTELVE